MSPNSNSPSNAAADSPAASIAQTVKTLSSAHLRDHALAGVLEAMVERFGGVDALADCWFEQYQLAAQAVLRNPDDSASRDLIRDTLLSMVHVEMAAGRYDAVQPGFSYQSRADKSRRETLRREAARWLR